MRSGLEWLSRTGWARCVLDGSGQGVAVKDMERMGLDGRGLAVMDRCGLVRRGLAVKDWCGPMGWCKEGRGSAVKA